MHRYLGGWEANSFPIHQIFYVLPAKGPSKCFTTWLTCKVLIENWDIAELLRLLCFYSLYTEACFQLMFIGGNSRGSHNYPQYTPPHNSILDLQLVNLTKFKVREVVSPSKGGFLGRLYWGKEINPFTPEGFLIHE